MTINQLCTRSVEFRAIEPSGDTQGDGRTMEGYGAVFDSPTHIRSYEGDFDETISAGAFRKTISEQKPKLQFDHGQDARVGSVPIGAINELREDDHGLYVNARLFDNPVVEPVRQAIEAGAISGMSFRFKVVRDTWTDKAGAEVRGAELERLLYNPGERGPLKRNIREVQLFEVGPVVYPAYESTSVGVRSISDADKRALFDEFKRAMAKPVPEALDLNEGADQADVEHALVDGNCVKCGY